MSAPLGVRAVAALVVAISVGALTPPATAQTGPGAPGISAGAAILVDLDDQNRVLFRRDVRTRRPVASLTKVVTALVVRDEYELDEIVTATNHVYATEGSSMGLRPGMRFTVEQLLHVLLLKSANDAAAVLAAHHELGYAHFIGLMNQKARALGAFDSSFRNPHGLDAANHYSSAWDMALFARQLLDDPVLERIVSTRSFRLRWVDDTGRNYANHNKLLTRFDGTFGVKTGYTLKAGHSLIAGARTDGGRYLTVVLKSEDHYADTTALFSYGDDVAAFAQQGGAGADLPDLFLGRPPEQPDIGVVAAISQPFRTDPRDGPWWIALMGVFAVLTVATVVGRRRDPLAAFASGSRPASDDAPPPAR